MSSTATIPAEARPSSTVVVVREGNSGPELLMVLRHAKSAFGASYVFPGGVLENTDQNIGAISSGLDDTAANAVLGLPAGGAAYFSAAIRELFEEAGILLARTSDGDWVNTRPFSTQREDLNGGRLIWSDFVRDNKLSLAYDALHYFSFWVTPREAPKRFSTRFFIAALPNGQEVKHCGGELTDSRWMGPAEAIAADKAGEIAIPHPTQLTLRKLGEFGTLESMLQWAAQCAKAGVDCYLPAVITIDGSQEVVMPDNPNYPTYPDGQ